MIIFKNNTIWNMGYLAIKELKIGFNQDTKTVSFISKTNNKKSKKTNGKNLLIIINTFLLFIFILFVMYCSYKNFRLNKNNNDRKLEKELMIEMEENI